MESDGFSTEKVVTRWDVRRNLDGHFAAASLNVLDTPVIIVTTSAAGFLDKYQLRNFEQRTMVKGVLMRTFAHPFWKILNHPPDAGSAVAASATLDKYTVIGP